MQVHPIGGSGTMKKPRRARTAKLEQVLVYYDQPQIAYLTGDRGYKMIAVAVEERAKMALPFFCCEISDRLFDAYLSGRVDLNYVLRQGKSNRYSFFDWASSDDGETFKLDTAKADEIASDDFYPQPGFFSENHTHRLKERQLAKPARLAFHIDGKWDAADFSKFVGRIDEIYSFSRIVETRGEKSHLLDAFLLDEIQPRSWTHGGDYTQFYRSLKSQSQASEALRVEKLAYNSPGEIVVRGEQEALREVADIVEAYKDKSDAAAGKYSSLRRLLSREGQLSRTVAAGDVSDGVKQLLLRMTNDLLNTVGMQNGPRLLEACGADAVVFSKVALSLIRRVRDAAQFYAEGRVSSDRFVETLAPST